MIEESLYVTFSSFGFFLHPALLLIPLFLQIGSANINDRSQKVCLLSILRCAFTEIFIFAQGNGDSEIALVVEDDDMINSTMDGEHYPVSRFAATLRRQLYKGENIITGIF